MILDSLADPDLMFPDLPAYDVPSVLRAFARRIVEQGKIDDANQLYEALWEREQLGSTGIGHGVAVPHCKTRGLDKVLLAVGHVKTPIDFGAVDGRPVRLFFVVISPDAQPAAHLQCLAAISRWIKESGDVDRLVELADPQAMYVSLTQRHA
jgi:nitrogen PTS system EIIA component